MKPARALELDIASSKGHNLGNIHSLHAASGRLFVGYASGTLEVYDVSNPHTAGISVTLDATISKTGSIVQIGSIGDVGVLIILHGSQVSLHDLDTLELNEELVGARGATCFATSQDISRNHEAISRLAIVSKRRVLIHEWRDSQFQETQEAQFPESLRSVTFAPNCDYIICGSASRFYTYNLDSKDLKEVKDDRADTATHASTASSFTAMGMSYMRLTGSVCHCISTGGDFTVAEQSSHLSFDEQSRTKATKPVVLVSSNRAKLVDSRGLLLKYEHEDDDKQFRDVVWPSNPKAVAYSRPYLVVAQPDHIQLENIELGSNLQNINIPGVRALTSGKLLYAASNTHIYRILLETDFRSIVHDLAEKVSLKEALSLLQQAEPVLVKDFENTLRDLQIKRAVELFHMGEYETALLLFSDISAPPNLVVELFPKNFLIEGSSEDDQETENPFISPEKRERAIRALLPYLADTRRKIEKLAVSKERVKFHGFELSGELYGDISEAAKLVDTTLFRCYAATGSSLVGPLVRLPNHCDPDVVEPVLKELARWNDLADFFFQRKIHRRALEFLKERGQQNENEDYVPTLLYLQKLNSSDLDLIFEFAEWPIQCDNDCFAQLFMDESSNCQSLPRVKVLRYLQSLDLPLEQEISYLEWSIDHGEVNPIFHNTLLSTYIASASENSRHNEKMLMFAITSSALRYDRALNELLDNKATATDPALLELKAVLLDRKDQYSDCLTVLFKEVGSIVKARDYCVSKFTQKDDELGQRLLHELLQYLISTDKTEAIRELLTSQGSRMSPKFVLETLKDDIGLTELQAFLQSHLRRLNNSHRMGKMTASLLKVDLVRTQEQLLEFSHRHATITNHSACVVCKKRLGRSVPAILPNGDIVHYGCLCN